MNTALRLGFGNALNAVHAAFKLKTTVSAVAYYFERNFLHAAQLVFVGVDFFYLPAHFFRIHVIHASDFACEQSRFLTACARTNFNDNVLFVVGVDGQ